MKKKKPITKYVRNIWMRKPQTQVVPNKKKYDRKREKAKNQKWQTRGE